MKTQFIKRTLYNLKRRYGDSADYYRVTSEVVDDRTGVTVQTRQGFTVKRLIRLPHQLQIGIMESGEVGGVFDKGKRRFILDAKDLPADFIPDSEDYIVFNLERYNVKEVEELDDRVGYLLECVFMDGAPLDRVFEASIEHALEITHTSAGVV